MLNDHMVLQRNDCVLLWGHSTGKEVNILTGWDGKHYKVKPDNSGNWSVRVPTTKEGGPYEIKFFDVDTTTLNDILLGEVWLLSGQSNMAMPLKGLKNQPVSGSAEALLHADNKQLRFFTVARAVASSPASGVSGKWQQSGAATAQDFSAVGFFMVQYCKKCCSFR
ncbi:hypothetical protein [Niabella ginsengisoli]|uniref:Sialate O-acetylesterase domain-containing protein n=1 Tax=Niabella ginsengisoli TaxID=522298 RepID=A0ABS9SJM1_9BACT|nr:hypothetical protein [Niabella ginsengisoli]MCH5598384.1 hypothetical protein [Niabella ginsengisoli]